MKRQAQINRVLSNPSGSEKAENLQDELASVQREMDDMGGLAVYQRMSTIGQGHDRGGGSEKVLIQWLQGLDENQRSDKSVSKLRYVRLSQLIRCLSDSDSSLDC